MTKTIRANQKDDRTWQGLTENQTLNRCGSWTGNWCDWLTKGNLGHDQSNLNWVQNPHKISIKLQLM